MSTSHVLDNPAWHALTNQHSSLAQGDELARRYPPDIALFGAVSANDKEAFDSLAKVFQSGEYVGLISGYPSDDERWTLVWPGTVIQMVYESPLVEPGESPYAITPLSHADVPNMLQLIELTHPGPFMQRTIELGGYIAIWQEGQLAAMAGNRLHLPGYHEISAVCTHPDFQKRGYARQLVLQLIRDIQRVGNTPFLHVASDNKGARSLYESIGFKQRTELPIFALKRE